MKNINLCAQYDQIVDLMTRGNDHKNDSHNLLAPRTKRVT